MWILNKSPLKAQTYKDWMKVLIEPSFGNDNKRKFNSSKKKKKQRHINALKKTKAYKSLTLPKVIEHLDASPERLLELHNELVGAIGNKHGQVKAIEWEVVKKVFDYGRYIEGAFSYQLAQLMDSNTCCYCNKQYTLTVIAKDGKTLIRPTFDHWFPQCNYPDLALSYYNLIPSCSLCNTSLKHDNMTVGLNTHIHPYVDMNVHFKFSYIPLSNGNQVKTLITTNDTKMRKRVENTLELFKIEDIYDAHSDYELKDLLDLSQEYSGDYIDFLINTVMADLRVSEHDTYRLLFSIESDKAKYLDRPFSKFKADIIKELRTAARKRNTP